MKPSQFSISALIRHAIDPSAPVPVSELQDSKFLDSEIARATQGFAVPFVSRAHCVPFDAQRDLTVAGSGSSLVGQEPQTLIDLLRGKLISTRVGIQIIPGLKGDAHLPLVTGDSGTEWQPEGTAATQAAPTVAKVIGTPKRLTGWFYISQKMIETAGPTADNFILSQLASNARRVLDKAIFFGSGPGNDQPTGIAGTSGVGSVDAADLGWDGVVEFETDVCESNADSEADVEMYFVLRPTDRSILKKRPKEVGFPAYLCDDSGRINGYQSVASTIITASSVFFGNFAGIYILLFGNGIPLLINPFSLDKERMVRIVFDLYCDVVVTQPAAISYASNLS